MEKRGFWQVAVSLDSTHAQWRTFVSLTLVFILLMVDCSRGESVAPHAEVYSSSGWPVDLCAEVRLFSLTRRMKLSCRDRVCFPMNFCCWVQFFPHAQTVEVDFPCESHAHCFVLGLLSSPRVFVLAVVSNCVLGHWVFVVSRFSTVVCV